MSMSPLANVGANILECLKECFCEDSCRDGQDMEFFLSFSKPKLGSCCNYINVRPVKIAPLEENDFPFRAQEPPKKCDAALTIAVDWIVELARPCAPTLTGDRGIDAPAPHEWECHGIEMMDDAYKMWCCICDAFHSDKLTGLGKQGKVMFGDITQGSIRSGQCTSWELRLTTLLPECDCSVVDFYEVKDCG